MNMHEFRPATCSLGQCDLTHRRKRTEEEASSWAMSEPNTRPTFRSMLTECNWESSFPRKRFPPSKGVAHVLTKEKSLSITFWSRRVHPTRAIMIALILIEKFAI